MVHLKVPSNFVVGGIKREENAQVAAAHRKQQQQTNTMIQIMFYKPPPNDPFMNRAVAWIDGPYSHVEIGFEDGMASSIYSGEKVFMHPRTFSNPNYTIISIPVTIDQERMARQFCTDHALRGVDFDGVGMYTARLPWVLRSIVGSFVKMGDDSRTFCSKYVVQVMQHIGVKCFEDLNPSTSSPSMVHRVLKNSDIMEHGENILGTTPYRRGLLATKGIVV